MSIVAHDALSIVFLWLERERERVLHNLRKTWYWVAWRLGRMLGEFYLPGNTTYPRHVLGLGRHIQFPLLNAVARSRFTDNTPFYNRQSLERDLEFLKDWAAGRAGDGSTRLGPGY